MPEPRNADRKPTSRSPSPRNTVRLSVISTSERRRPQPLPHQIGGRHTRAVVVDADVTAARTGRHVGRIRDHRYARLNEAVDGLGHLGFILRLEHHAVAAAQTPQRVDHLRRRARLPQMEACPHHGRREGRQLGLDRGAEGVGEPLRRLHDDVDEVAAADQAQLGALLVQVGDGLHDLGPGVLPDPGPLVEHTVDGGLAQPGLLRDLADLVAVPHGPS